MSKVLEKELDREIKKLEERIMALHAARVAVSGQTTMQVEVTIPGIPKAKRVYKKRARIRATKRKGKGANIMREPKHGGMGLYIKALLEKAKGSMHVNEITLATIAAWKDGKLNGVGSQPTPQAVAGPLSAYTCFSNTKKGYWKYVA